MNIKKLREKYNISLRELERVSGIPRPTINAIEHGRFRLSSDKAERLELAIKLIAEHKRRWRELPKQLKREFKSKSKKGE